MVVDLAHASTIYGTDSEGLAQLLGGRTPGKWGKAIYWRRPQENFLGEEDAHAGWITTDDADSQKRLNRMELGYTPLTKFPPVRRSKEKWVPILSHPEGPAQFPLSQIIEMRFYDPRVLRRIWPDIPRKYLEPGVGPARLFPQLRGVTIEQIPCPNCRQRDFHKAEHLFNHLHTTHGFTVEAIYAYGKQEGINFSRSIDGRAVTSVTFGAAEDEPDDEEAVAPVAVATRRPGRPLAAPPVAESTQSAREKFDRVAAVRGEESEA